MSFCTINSYSQLQKANKFAKTITAEELKDHLYVYASDEFEGRNTGAKGQKKAVEYLRSFYIKNEIETHIMLISGSEFLVISSSTQQYSQFFFRLLLP